MRPKPRLRRPHPQTPAPAADYLKPTTLDTIKVIGQRLFPCQEGMVLNERHIDDQVRGNGDLGTLLRINPNVQFDDSAAARCRTRCCSRWICTRANWKRSPSSCAPCSAPA